MPTPAPLNQPQLELCFSASARGETYLSRQLGGYPYHVGRLLPNAVVGAPKAQVIIQSSSGGIFENDRLHQRFTVHDGAAAQVNTAASTIVHTMTGGRAVSIITIEVGANARLDYLPQPTILFPHCELFNQIDLTLHPGATVLLSDAYLTHDPSGRDQTLKDLTTQITIRDAHGRVRARDRFVLTALAMRAGGVGGIKQTQQSWRAHGGLLVLKLDEPDLAADDTLAARLNRALQADPSPAGATASAASAPACYAGAGTLPGHCGTFVRMLAHDGLNLQRALQTALETSRLTLPPCSRPTATPG
ncbi:MAG: urease accessory protein UreD [Janthinobacterium lividum]